MFGKNKSKILPQVLIITPLKQNKITETRRIMKQKKWPKLNLGGFRSQVLINSTIFATFIFLVSRRVTRNFSGQGSFLGIRALRWTIIYGTRKNGPQGKISIFFSWKNKNCALNETFNPLMTTIRASFPEGKPLFSNFRKRADETSTPPPSSYASCFCFVLP